MPALILKNSWEMSRLSDKLTGELPILFVYELDASNLAGKRDELAGEEKSSNQCELEDSSKPSPSLEVSMNVKYSFLAICQRKIDLSNKPMLHPWYQRVFGTPFILRVADLEGYTGRDLYDLIAKRVQRYVPKGVLAFLKERQKSSDKLSCSDLTESSSSGRIRRGRHQRFHQTKSDAEISFFGSIPRYGFRLRVTSREGKCCDLCPWYECCIGCVVTDDDYPTIAMCGDTISIDWHIGIDLVTDCFDTLPNSEPQPVGNMLTNVKKHKTCHYGKNKLGRGHITLDDCLAAFSKEEDMQDVSYTRKHRTRKLILPFHSLLTRLIHITDLLLQLQRTSYADKVNESLATSTYYDHYSEALSVHGAYEEKVERLRTLSCRGSGLFENSGIR